jgi:hypothetical protein
MNCIQCIGNKFANAIIGCCQEMGCELKINNLNNYIVLKGEKVCSNSKICDCLLFAEDSNCIIIGVVELKRKDIHANEIIEKLCNGLITVLDILVKCCSNNIKYDCYPILLYKNIRPPEYEIITSKKIKAKGKEYKIRPAQCGSSFLYLISR